MAFKHTSFSKKHFQCFVLIPLSPRIIVQELRTGNDFCFRPWYFQTNTTTYEKSFFSLFFTEAEIGAS